MTEAQSAVRQIASASRAPLLRLHGLSKSYGQVPAVHPLDLEIFPQDFVAILGPSGCGKTTLLRMIGGFVGPSTGRIEIDGNDVTALGPEKRPTNMVFQGYGLFPHMNVRQNVGYGLRIQRRPATEVADRVSDVLHLSRLSELSDRPVSALSGGQQQRVALARALVMRPKVLLLDEPLAALDLKLRHAMQDELRRLHGEIGGTFVVVTHDQGEALNLANRIAVMNAGRLEQEGPAESIYYEPCTRFVASFVGEANCLDARRKEGVVRLLDGTVVVRDGGEDEQVAVVVRPHAVQVLGEGESQDVAVDGAVEDVVFLGELVRCNLRLDGGQRLAFHLGAGQRRPVRGTRVRVGWPTASQRIVPT